MSMTESEKVKKWFDSELSMRTEESLDSVECEEIKDICLNAIEEREQYRAIGLGSPDEAEQDLLLYKADREVLREYEAIGTVSEFRELKEKAKAKRPFGEYFGWTCPNCGEYHREKKSHCTECNQTILWT